MPLLVAPLLRCLTLPDPSLSYPMEQVCIVDGLAHAELSRSAPSGEVPDAELDRIALSSNQQASPHQPASCVLTTAVGREAE